MFTATAICKLSEGNILSLDDPIEKWLLERYLNLAAGYGKITVRLLLNHRSGIGDYDERAILSLQREQPMNPVSVDCTIPQGLLRAP